VKTGEQFEKVLTDSSKQLSVN